MLLVSHSFFSRLFCDHAIPRENNIVMTKIKKTNMGRKPYASKGRERAPMKFEGREELPPQITSSLERAELWTEKTNQSLEKVEPQPKMQANSGNISLKRKEKHAVSITVRRSGRLQGTVIHTHNEDVERVIEEVALSESEKEDEPPAYREMEQPKPAKEDKNLEDKVDYLVQLIESQQSKLIPHESPCMCHARYKSLYFDAQKKIETLTNENHQLALKLENAMGKLEAKHAVLQSVLDIRFVIGISSSVNEKHTRSYSELLEKWKDMIFISNLTKAAENISSQSQHTQEAVCEAKISSAKRKKGDK